MSEILRFKLNKKYRNPISIGSDESIFHGRKDEVNRLTNIIKNRDSATVLVSGLRGVGKTSFVREVIRRINGDKYFMVDISLANVDPKEEKDLKEKILKSMIRGLYFCKNRPKSEELEALYDKTYYSEISEKGLVELAKQSSIESSETITKENKYTLSTDEVTTRIIGASLLSIANCILLPRLDGWLFTLAIISNILLVFVLLKIKIEKTQTAKNNNKNLDYINKKVGTTNLAQLDLSPDTLEIKLHHLLKDYFSNSNKKAIFVIDELDKIDNEEFDQINNHPIYKIIKPLKNLFTLSNAIFIFITDEDFYDIIEKEKNDRPYSASYTLFTDRIFLPALYYEDIEELINKYNEDREEQKNNLNYNKFKSFISWQAKNHIFDVHNLIENYTENDNNGDSYVSVRTHEDLKKGNIGEYWEVAAALQVYLGAVYDNHFYPDNHRLNEKLYLTLREVCEILYQDEEISIKNDDYLSVLSEEVQNKLKINEGEIEENKREDFDGAIQDLLQRMETRGLLTSNEKNEKIENGEVEKTIDFTIINTEYPNIKDIKEVNKRLNHEEIFINSLDKLNIIRTNLKNSYIDILDEYSKEIEKLNRFAVPIREEKYRKLRKSQVIIFTDKIEKITDNLFIKVMNFLLNRLVDNDNNIKRLEINIGVTGQPLWIEDEKIKSFYNYINTEIDENSYTIFYKNDKYVLFGFDFDKEIQDEYLSIRKYDRHLAKTKIINFIFSETNTIVKERKWNTFNIENDFSNLKKVNDYLIKIFKDIK